MKTDFTQDFRCPLRCIIVVFLVLMRYCLSHAAPPLDGIWQEEFNDHFNGKSLNTANWTDDTLTNAPISGMTYYGLTYTKPVLKQHRLRFYVEPQVSSVNTNHIALGATGPVHTAKTYHLQYGYCEMRVHIPQGPFRCEARLLTAGGTSSHASITVFTTDAATPGDLCGKVTLANELASTTVVTLNTEKVDLTVAEHLIGLEWTPQQIVWFVDGQPAARTTQSVQEKMYLSLSFGLENMQETVQHPLLTHPAEFLVGDVRIYHKVGEIDTAPPLVYCTSLDTTISLETASSKISVLPDGRFSTDTFYAERRYVSAITLLFDEPLDKTTAEDVAHYHVNGARIKRAILRHDHHTVQLELKKVDQRDLSLLYITGVKDLDGNATQLTLTIGNNPFVISPRD